MLRAVIASGILVLGFAAATPAAAQYRPMPLLGGGYKDKQLGDTRWNIRGFSTDAIPDHALDTALYRAALLVKAAGFPRFKIVRGFLNFGYDETGNLTDQNAEFVIVATNGSGDEIACETSKNKPMCKMVEVESTIRTSGAALGRSPEQIERDLAAIRARKKS